MFMCCNIRPPAENIQQFVESLSELLQHVHLNAQYNDYESVVMAGDFNEYLLNEKSKPIMSKFEEFKFKQVVNSSTTDKGSLLNAAYVK